MKCASRPCAGATQFRSSAKSFLSILLSIVFVFPAGIALPTPAAAAAKDKKAKQDPALKGLPITELSADEAILHALNRLAYGPRPGDVERVRQMGLAKWIEQQLNPNAIDDRAVEARLEQFPTLRMSSAKLLAEYPQPKQQQKQAAARNVQTERPGDTAATVARDIADKGAQSPQSGQALQGEQAAQEPTPGAESAESMKDDANAAAAMKQEPPAEMNAATRGAGKRDLLGGGDPNAVPRAIADDSKRPQRVVEELAMSKVARAIYSERQLQQVMDDFWFNHFNVFAGKGEDRWFLTSYEGDVIQPHTMGKFKDLLTATAKSPAMLFYLDNFLSADPRAADRMAAERAARQRRRGGFGRPRPQRVPQQQRAKKNVRGLNEGRGAGDRIAGATSEHSKIYFHKAGATVCVGYSPTIAGGADGADISIERRGYSRGAEDDDLFAGILVARSLPGKDQDAVRAGGVYGAGAGRGCGYADAAGAVDGAHRGAAVSVPAAYGLRGQIGCLGEYRGTAEPIELFAGAGGKQSAGLAKRCGSAAGSGGGWRCEGGAESRGAGFSWRADGGYYSGDAAETARQSAGAAGETG